MSTYSSRINSLFQALKEKNETALIPFITAGYPNKDMTVSLLHTLVKNGADMIEIGVPFSDPVADGPVIQASSFEAIQNGVTTHTVFDMVEAFRRDNQTTPIILMGYANPIESFGWEAYAQQAQSVGVDGLLTVDLQPEPEDEWGDVCQDNHINRVILLAPTTSQERQVYLTKFASGFIYYVALKGVTGSDSLHSQEQGVAKAVNELKSLTSVPIVVGFGVKDVASAKKLSQYADGVVVGSQMINILSQYRDDTDEGIRKVGEFTAQLKEAINI